MGLIPRCCKSAMDPGTRLWTFVSTNLLLLMELVLLMICKNQLVCLLSQTPHAYWGSYRSQEGDSPSLSILTVISHDATAAQLNLESNDVLLAPAHVAFLTLASFHTVPFPFFDYLLLPSLDFVSGQISTFLHRLFLLLRSPYTTGT